jgi:hypothetical protein
MIKFNKEFEDKIMIWESDYRNKKRTFSDIIKEVYEIGEKDGETVVWKMRAGEFDKSVDRCEHRQWDDLD